jgi:transposase
MGKKAVSYQKKMEIVSLKKHTQYSNRQIAKRVGCDEKCVRNTWSAYQLTGDVKDKPRSGRPTKTTDREKSLIFLDSRRNPLFSSQKLAARFTKTSKKSISRTTVDRILNNKELLSFRMTRKPLLRPSHMIIRRRLCKERLNWTDEKWKSVIFSDESNFELINRKKTIRVRRFACEKYSLLYTKPREQGGGGSIGIWGCISGHGVGSIATYNGRLNAIGYQEILEKVLIPT